MSFKREEDTRTATNEQMVHDYFALISKKDIDGLLRLFAEDAVVYEPFSTLSGGLCGKDAIKDFLKITILAISETHPVINFINGLPESHTESNIEADEITALVTFQKNGTLKGKFHFRFVIISEVCEDTRGFSMTMPSKKIKELHMQIVK